MSPKEEPAPNVGVATVLSAGTHAVGELHSKEDLVLVGSFEGKMMVERALRIMPEASVDGEIRAGRILVLGRTQGTLLAQERIEIKAGAVVTGEVVAPQIRIHEGVILNARVHMSGPPSAAGAVASVAVPASVTPMANATSPASPTVAANVAVSMPPVAPVRPEPVAVAEAAPLPVVAPPPAPAPAAPTAAPTPTARPAGAPSSRAGWGWGPKRANAARSTEGPSRHYLLPALLRSLGDASNEDIETAERATENFLRGLGFELETRAAHPDRTGALRPIFRSSEPLPYATLRERLQHLEQALRVAVSDGAEPPLQGTGTSGAHEVAMALARLRRAALVVGPVALVRRDEFPGDLHLSVRVRRPLPEPADSPDPASLLLSLQKMQHELLDELG